LELAKPRDHSPAQRPHDLRITVNPIVRRSASSVVLATFAVGLLVATILLLGRGAAVAPPRPAGKPDAARLLPPPELSTTVSATGQLTPLRTASGRAVARLHTGWYSVRITVDSTKAGFYLAGPNVHRATSPRSMDLAIWGIHFVRGTYRYMNDNNARATTRVISVY
jgi:hypothetical protein